MGPSIDGSPWITVIDVVPRYYSRAELNLEPVYPDCECCVGFQIWILLKLWHCLDKDLWAFVDNGV